MTRFYHKTEHSESENEIYHYKCYLIDLIMAAYKDRKQNESYSIILKQQRNVHKRKSKRNESHNASHNTTFGEKE
jgi:hypothetical protein